MAYLAVKVLTALQPRTDFGGIWRCTQEATCCRIRDCKRSAGSCFTQNANIRRYKWSYPIQDRPTPTGVAHCQSVSPYHDMSMSTPAPSKTATDKTNLDVNAMHLFFRAACQDQKKASERPQNWPVRLSRNTALTKGPAIKFPTPKLLPVRQLSLSDLMPRLSANTLWRETPDGPSQGRCLSFWERSKSSSNG